MRTLFIKLVLDFLLLPFLVNAQSDNFNFALITDLHTGSSTAASDLRQSVDDINHNDSLSFVLISGDITEMGTDKELYLAKQILDSLNKKWYIIPGNHDTKWSESGCNSFRKIFGAELFSFRFGNYLFIGNSSGPNMRMSPGQVPREHIVWLDSILIDPLNKDLSIIYINHYPLNNELNNWFEIIDRLKKSDIRLLLCGHGHANKLMDLEGIPGIMGRSNLRAGSPHGGYNIMTIYGDSVLKASVKLVSQPVDTSWVSVKLINHRFAEDTTHWPRPDFSINDSFPIVKEQWRLEENSDIGSGMDIERKLIVSTNTQGHIFALDIRNGKKRWQYGTGAKIYSTPVINDNRVYATATDGVVYCLKLKTGKNLWQFSTGNSIVASPVIHGKKLFVAGSGGKLFCLDTGSGDVLWENKEIKGFAETRPLVYNGVLLFGTWDNHFYAIDINNGKVIWDRNDLNTVRNLSPAACVPVAVPGRVFIVAPDRKMTCLDLSDGKIIWRSALNGNRVRESMGLSEDSTLVFAKTMDGDVIGVSSTGAEGEIIWKGDMNAGYDLTPSVIVERTGIVFVPTDKGFVYAIRRSDGKLLWVHRISSCLVNQVMPVDEHSVVCSTMDGVITKLVY